MSTTLTKRQRGELQATNIGLRLLFDNTQARTSATIYLQWCVVKAIADYLRDKAMKYPMLFVTIMDPERREVRYVFDFTSSREVIQFHSPGTHTICATIIWGEKPKVARRWLLHKQLGRYKYALHDLLGKCDKKLRINVGFKRLGAARLPIDVPSEFFAPQLSARESNWINLLFTSLPPHSCSINRRRLFAYTVQPLIIVPWILLKMLWRFVIAFFFSVLCACRCDWSAIFHPFTQDYKDVWTDKDNNFSWIAWKADGRERWWGEWSLLFTPLIHVFLSGMTVWAMRIYGADVTFTNFGVAYVATIVAVAAFASLVVGAHFFFSRVGSWWEKSWQKLVARWQADCLEQLLCVNAPVRGLRPVGYTPRLLYQRVKAAYCRPVVS